MSGITQESYLEFMKELDKKNLSPEEREKEIQAWKEIFQRDMDAEREYENGSDDDYRRDKEYGR